MPRRSIRLPRRALPVDTVELARFLVGQVLVHCIDGERLAGRIVETEAYPPGDPTGYARPGLTTSNAPLFANRSGNGTIGPWETFTPWPNDDGTISLRSLANGKWVTAFDPDDGSVRLTATATGIGGSESFELNVL